ncbi:MAG: hypothetical protein GEU98_09135 [Pseudonocardiaceae bacterium]|nr:hypothetical protein [Pseudonocardiaceae bacterium]
MLEVSDTTRDTRGVWETPAKHRPGKSAWLGPVALLLALGSWATPLAGPAMALAATIAGAVSIATRRQFRIDWTAIAGIVTGLGQLLFALILFTMETSGL